MGKFVERYVRIPLEQVDQNAGTLLPLSIIDNGSNISIQLGSQQFTIPRVRPELQIEEPDKEADGD
jgi:hypothetical protein